MTSISESLASRPLLPGAKLSLVLLAVIAAAVTVMLWPQWRHNPDLSHGLFMPIVCLLLLHEARTHGTWRFLPAGAALNFAVAAALLLGLAALALAGLYAAAIDWSNTVTSFALAMSLAWLLLATTLSFASRDVRLLPFNWSSVLAAGLWVLSAPIPPGTYSRLTFTLQLFVSRNVLHALHLLGIAASLQGNIIELAHTSVGVEEACSGVRSLVSCVFAGLFFSGLLVRRPWSRALLIGLAAPLALVMNFLRSLTLTLLANSGVNSAGTWHDLTGFAVLGVTALLLAALALFLERSEKTEIQRTEELRTEDRETDKSETATLSPPPFPIARPLSSVLRPPSSAPLFLSASGLVLAIALGAFFAFHMSFKPPVAVPLPDLDAILPGEAAGWNVTTEDLSRFKDILLTAHFVQRAYVRSEPDGVHQILVYVAYWSPGQASASLVATHTPDACWPGTGWLPVPAESAREPVHTADRVLPPAEQRLFREADGYPQYVWFWQLYGRAPIPYLDPRTPSDLIKIALHYGFRRPGEQMFVRVSSNRPWNEIANEPLIVEIFHHLQPLGL